MTSAGHEPLHADCAGTSDVEQIASNYLLESGGDPHRALRRIIVDALADLLELDRRGRRSERLISHGYVRGHLDRGR